MHEGEIPRKWVFIADKLRMLNAPKKVINAAVELDRLMVKLSLGDNTPYWERHYNEYRVSEDLGDLDKLIFCRASCTACVDVDNMCVNCKLGIKGNCTPRSRYADNYFYIIGIWSLTNLR